MHWLLRSTVILFILLCVYAVWPFYGMYKLSAAVEARNAAAVEDLVDFPSLRRSLAQQIVGAYLKITGRGSGLGQMGTAIATSIGASIADPMVAKLVNPEALIALLNKGSTGEGNNGPNLIAPMATSSFSNLGKLWWNSEYSGANFYASLPPDAPSPQQFRVRLRLLQWKWKPG